MTNRRKIAGVLKKAKLATTTVDICFRPDLVREYKILEGANRNSLSDDRETRLAQLAKDIDAESIVFTLQASHRSRWAERIAENPPRKDHKDDLAQGYNISSYFESLVRDSVIDPVLTDEEWEQLDAVLTEAQWNKLALTAQSINMSAVDIPFSRPV